MSLGVSVIICCYNSEARIVPTLHHLSRQEVPENLFWEVIVVDNASTDNTVLVATRSWVSKSSNVLFKIVNQPIPGLSHARKKGIENSSYDILIFCDDDNHFQNDYVTKAFQIMIARPEVGIAGGLSKPKFTVNPGKWICDFYAALAIGESGKPDSYVNWVFGAGMILKKRIFNELRTRNISFLLSDRVGKKQTSGGDSEMCLLVRFLGYKVYYSSQLVFEHCISTHRLTKFDFFKKSHQNFFAVAYLFLLEGLMVHSSVSASKLFFSLVTKRLLSIISFTPRIFVGNHRYYSFLTVYGNIFFVFWLFIRLQKFHKTYRSIKVNLYNGN